MSWQALEAVQDCEAIQDHTALVIMYALARFADADGVIGANGRRTAPSIDTIAARSRCHRNTVLNWLPKLEADGVLKVERFGTGRGSWNRYTLLVPIDNNGTSDGVNGTSPVPIDDGNGTSDYPNGTTDVPKLELMVQAMAARLDLLVQVMVHNGTTQDVPDTKDTDPRKKRREEKYIYIPPDPEPIANIKTALAATTKTPLWEPTKDEYDDAAHMLIGWDATPEQVRGFNVWWDKNGYYAGKPALKSLLDEWTNYTAGVVAGHKPNGKHPNGNHQAAPAVAHFEAGPDGRY